MAHLSTPTSLYFLCSFGHNGQELLFLGGRSHTHKPLVVNTSVKLLTHQHLFIPLCLYVPFTPLCTSFHLFLLLSISLLKHMHSLSILPVPAHILDPVVSCTPFCPYPSFHPFVLCPHCREQRDGREFNHLSSLHTFYSFLWPCLVHVYLSYPSFASLNPQLTHHTPTSIHFCYILACPSVPPYLL